MYVCVCLGGGHTLSRAKRALQWVQRGPQTLLTSGPRGPWEEADKAGQPSCPPGVWDAWGLGLQPGVRDQPNHPFTTKQPALFCASLKLRPSDFIHVVVTFYYRKFQTHTKQAGLKLLQ